ncbi:MAG TPA: xanthine dehydrogenase family protein molybdopterin-binding subunit [Vicinamibacterales bacterium]|nr:xanthine dehydrogenase family protein molybdopterin-binding subunit [Vicinamibacterales bacterium]
MPDKYTWPSADQRSYIGKRFARVDGVPKSTGKAKYTYDYNPKGLLYGAFVRCPYAHARVKSIDTSAAEAMKGVKAIEVVQGPGKEIHWAGDEIVALAAVDEPTMRDAVRAVKVEYEVLPHLVIDEKEPPKDIPPDTSPLSQSDLEGMFSNQVPQGQIVAAIKERGISFKPTDVPLDRAPAPIADAIRNAQQKEAPANKAPVWYKPAAADTTGEPDAAFKAADVVVSEGVYGLPVITHCCLESHGSVSEWPDEQHLLVHASTQFISGIPGQMADAVGVPAANIRAVMPHIGGGFGSKFGPDRWGIYSAKLSKKAGGAPVKMMLNRAEELMVAGSRPSAYARVKVAAKKDGTLTAWDSFGWGTGGPGGGGSPPIPYLFQGASSGIPHRRTQWTAVVNNIGPSRAWRAPNHPQACLITMSALDDLAAKLNMNPLEFFTKNADLTGQRAQIYKDEFLVADELMGWSKNWHPRGDKAAGPIKRGLGLSMHTWGGRGHQSECDLIIQPDGSVTLKMGTQDLGTGTRTAIMLVAADTLGIKPNQVNLLYGDTQYPTSGGSGGSTTIGGVSSTTRRAAVDARDALFAKVAPALGAQPDQLEAVNGQVRVKGTPSKALSWKDACAKIGAVPISAHGKNLGGRDELMNSGVGGVQMADVSVDVETGVVKVNKMVAVQDCGLVVSLEQAESQVYGALIMGISYSLYEEKVMDPTTGRMLNPNMEFYRLAGIGDIGELVVRMMVNKYDDRGVIGLGEPPVVSPGAALSNAVANAIGVRVPFLPLTPNRVLAALESAGKGEQA